MTSRERTWAYIKGTVLKGILAYEYLKFQPLHIASSPFCAGRASKREVFPRCGWNAANWIFNLAWFRKGLAIILHVSTGVIQKEYFRSRFLPTIAYARRKTETDKRTAWRSLYKNQKQIENVPRKNEGCVRNLRMFCPLLAVAARRFFRYSGCHIPYKWHNRILAVRILVS